MNWHVVPKEEREEEEDEEDGGKDCWLALFKCTDAFLYIAA